MLMAQALRAMVTIAAMITDTTMGKPAAVCWAWRSC